MELSAGARVGPYEVASLLGAGGMGEVYRAFDHRLGREVALKVLPSSVASDADRLRRFELEARAVAALNHPNILAVFDVGSDDGRSYLVSELLEGETLRTRLGGTALPMRKALDYAIQIAHGLAAAHDKGIVHRDLKPENLFVTRDGRVKILDFGLAKLSPIEGSPVSTQDLTRSQPGEGTTSGALLGTVGYMSPEQVRLLPADSRSDIFSFGAILYEMLSGQRAFRGETPTDTMHAILRADPPELSLNQISPSVTRVVRHCLEKSPDERFQSARDLAFDLQAITEASGVVLPPSPWKPRLLGLRSLLAAGLLLGVSAASLLVGRMTSRTPPPSYQRMTFRSGLVFSARFGADGRTVVYSAAWQGRPLELFVTEAGTNAFRPLALPEARLLALSPTNEMALLLKPQISGWFVHRGTLARAPLAGGVPRELLEDVEDADWSADGKDLAVVHCVDDDACRLEFPIGHVLYAPTAPGWLSDIRVSPRGDRVAFVEHPQDGDLHGSVAVVDRNGARQTLATGLVHVSGTAWSASGDEVLFTGSHERSSSNYLSAVSLSGSERVLARAPGSFVLLDMIPGGRGLFRTLLPSTPILFRGPGDSRERDLSELDLSFVVDLSRDGRALLGVDQGAGVGPHWAIFLRPTDGSPAVWLGEGDPLALSPDGKWVLTRRFYLSPQKLVLVPTGAGQSQELETGPLERYMEGKWFPDGRRILFSAIEPGRRARLYVQDLDGGKPRAVGPEGLRLPELGGAVSPDGIRTIALDPDSGPALYTIGGTEVTPVPGLEPGDQPIGWSDDGRGILFYRPAASALAVLRLDLASGQTSVVRELLSSSPSGMFGHYRVLATPDGRSFAYGYLRQSTDLYLGEGF